MIDYLISVIVSILSFTPLLGLAVLGLLVTQKSGVWNIGVEGIMIMGAFSAIFAYSFMGQNIWFSMIFSYLIGAAFGVILAFLCIKHKLNQLIVGFGLWFAGNGLAGFLYGITNPRVSIGERLPNFLSLDTIFYLTIALFIIVFIVFNHTKQGLAIICCGENPKAGDCAGLNVNKVRTICTIIGGGLMALAGGYVAIAVLRGFDYQMVLGYGWMAFAILIFGRFSTFGVLASSLIFTALVGLQNRLQILGLQFMPIEFMVVLPHIGVILGLFLTAVLGKKTGIPAAIGIHYDRE